MIVLTEEEAVEVAKELTVAAIARMELLDSNMKFASILGDYLATVFVTVLKALPVEGQTDE